MTEPTQTLNSTKARELVNKGSREDCRISNVHAKLELKTHCPSWLKAAVAALR